MLLYLTIVTVILLLIIGLYSLLTTRNLIRVLISIEILMKAVTLPIIIFGFVINRVAMSQAMVITLIVIEVVSVATGSGIAVAMFRRYNTLNLDEIRSLKRQGD